MTQTHGARSGRWVPAGRSSNNTLPWRPSGEAGERLIRVGEITIVPGFEERVAFANLWHVSKSRRFLF